MKFLDQPLAPDPVIEVYKKVMDRTLIRDLQRAFRDFHRQRPRYEMLPVQSRKEDAGIQGGAPGLDSDGAGDDLEGAAPRETVAAGDRMEELATRVTPQRGGSRSTESFKGRKPGERLHF